MQIEQNHALGKDEVKKRAEALADGLTTMPLPSGIDIGSIVREWHEDTMDFSFRVSKGFFGATIKGTVVVADTTAVLDLAIPSIVKSFIDEEQIRNVLQTKMAETLA